VVDASAAVTDGAEPAGPVDGAADPGVVPEDASAAVPVGAIVEVAAAPVPRSFAWPPHATATSASALAAIAARNGRRTGINP
jgi:hypothetical protein